MIAFVAVDALDQGNLIIRSGLKPLGDELAAYKLDNSIQCLKSLFGWKAILDPFARVAFSKD